MQRPRWPRRQPRRQGRHAVVLVAGAAVLCAVRGRSEEATPAAPQWDAPWHVRDPDSPWAAAPDRGGWEVLLPPARASTAAAASDYWERVAVGAGGGGTAKAVWQFASRMEGGSNGTEAYEYGAYPPALASLLHTRLPRAALCGGDGDVLHEIADVYVSIAGGRWLGEAWGEAALCSSGAGLPCTPAVLPTGVALTIRWVPAPRAAGGGASGMTLEQVAFAVAYAVARVPLRRTPFASGAAAALPLARAGCAPSHASTITTSLTVPPPDSSHSSVSLAVLRSLLAAATPCAGSDSAGAVDCGVGGDDGGCTLAACAASAPPAAARGWGVGVAATLIPSTFTSAPWHAAVVSAGWTPDRSRLLHRTTFAAVLPLPAPCPTLPHIPVVAVLGLSLPHTACCALPVEPAAASGRLQPCVAAPRATFDLMPAGGGSDDAAAASSSDPAPLAALAVASLPAASATRVSLPRAPGVSRMAAQPSLGAAVVTSSVWAAPSCPDAARVEWVEPLPWHWHAAVASVAVHCVAPLPPRTPPLPLAATASVHGCGAVPCTLHVAAAGVPPNCTAFRLRYAAAVPALPPADALPADLHRGLPAASGLVRLACASLAGLATLPTPTLLLEPPAPDFAMPLNVMTLVSTVAAFLLGRFINVLARPLPRTPAPAPAPAPAAH